MANLEDIKAILIESRQAFIVAHKEMLAAVKGSSASGTKATRQGGRSGGGGDFRMPDMSGIMPDDMRQIFASFQNTLRQIFGGTSLSKFETTLKNTIGRAVGGQGHGFVKQLLATSSGLAARDALKSRSVPADSILHAVAPQRFHWKSFFKLGQTRAAYPSVFWQGFVPSISKPVLKKQLKGETDYQFIERLRALGADPYKGQFARYMPWRSGLSSAMNMAGVPWYSPGRPPDRIKLKERWSINPATINPAAEAWRFITDSLSAKKAEKEQQTISTTPLPPAKFTKLGRLGRWMDAVPAIGNLVDRFKKWGSMFTDIVGPLARVPVGKGWAGSSARLLAAGRIGLGAFPAALTAGKAAWSAARLGGAGILRAGLTAGSAMKTAATTGLAVAGVTAGLTNPIGWAIALTLATSAVAGFTEIMWKSQDRLKNFNGDIARVFARSEVNKIQRNIRSGENRAAVTGWLQYQSDALKENLRPMWDTLFNILGGILAGIMAIINLLAVLFKLAEYARNPVKGIKDTIHEVWEWAKGIWGTKSDFGPLGNTLREFGEGRASKYLDPNIFKWEGA
jgi:hypothetical protein